MKLLSLKHSLFPCLWLLCMVVMPLHAQPTLVPGNGKLMVRELSPRKGFELLNTSAFGPRVLARVPEGNISKAMEHPTFRWILECYERSERVPVRNYTMNMASYPQRVEPLLTDLWHQFAPYNTLAPQIEGESCAVGCVAHAMAQVIRYHRFAQGSGTYTYIDSVGCKQTLTAEFPAGGYNFEQMLDVYDEGRYSPAELMAVASLLRDCGILVNMQYGVDASGAYSIRQPQALTGFFGYDKGMQMCYRDFYTYSEWELMLKRELAEGRPVLMSAQSPSLAHAFCCDGYDEQGLFHLNLGMSGEVDGYYYLPYLTPKQPEWYDENNPEGGMNLLQYMTIGIQPPLSSPEMQTERHSYGFSHIEAVRSKGLLADTLSIATHCLANVGWNYHQGKVALLLKKNDKIITSLAEYPHEFQFADIDGIAYTDTLSFVLPANTEEGVYRVVPCFEEGQGSWEEARTSVGTPNYLMLNVGKDSVHLCTNELASAYLTLEDYDFPDTIVRATKPPFSIGLRCHRAEFCGRFYVVLSPEDNPNDLRIIQYQGLTLSDGEETFRQFNRTWVGVASGPYHLRVAYEGNLFTDSLVWLSEEPLKTIHVVEPGTSVGKVEAEGGNAKYYDMGGRRLPEGITSKGLVIRQGDNRKNKKIIMK